MSFSNMFINQIGKQGKDRWYRFIQWNPKKASGTTEGSWAGPVLGRPRPSGQVGGPAVTLQPGDALGLLSQRRATSK